MNPFQQSETIGRQKFAEFLKQAKITDFTFTENPFDNADGYYNHKGRKVVFEIKVRDQKYLNYPSLIIEESKYQRLKKIKERDNCQAALYVNFIGNKLFIFPLSVVSNFPIQILKTKKYTVIDSEMAQKNVRYLSLDKAQKFEQVNGKWKNLNL